MFLFFVNFAKLLISPPCFNARIFLWQFTSMQQIISTYYILSHWALIFNKSVVNFNGALSLGTSLKQHASIYATMPSCLPSLNWSLLPACLCHIFWFYTLNQSCIDNRLLFLKFSHFSDCILSKFILLLVPFLMSCDYKYISN